MQIIPDPLMILMQLVPFLVTALALNHIIFKPMLAYLDARDAALDDGRKMVGAIEGRVSDTLSSYEAQLAQAKVDMTDIRMRSRAEASVAYEERVGVARAEAETNIETAVTEIAASADKARKELGGKTETLASDIAGRVLGRPVEAR